MFSARSTSSRFAETRPASRSSLDVVAGLISRVLFGKRVAPLLVAVIPLGRALPRASCGLPRGSGGQPSSAPLRGLAPDGVYRAAIVTDRAVGSYPTVSPLPTGRRRRVGGFSFSVALSSRFPSPGVTRHPALWSPDFPPVANDERSPEPLRRRHLSSGRRARANQKGRYKRQTGPRGPRSNGFFSGGSGGAEPDVLQRAEIADARLQLPLGARFQLPGALARDA